MYHARARLKSGKEQAAWGVLAPWPGLIPDTLNENSIVRDPNSDLRASGQREFQQFDWNLQEKQTY